ncbi:MAG: cytochrome C oxidase subunit III [Verrucomicrobia bacterium]|nr:MAG: cytochrome C oxidase subunit III [Verrucomicrobiota bacterium]
MANPSENNPSGIPVRPHTYDGIQEYDNRLPNWWLFTLYITIAFSIVYWFYYHISGVGATDEEKLAVALQQVEEARKASAVGDLDDAKLWAMSRDDAVVAAGREVFETNCVACHLASLRGKEESPAAIGPSLVDSEWIHGGNPMDIRNTVSNGVLEKGMPAWGTVLGDQKVAEVVAYILSHHDAPAGN